MSSGKLRVLILRCKHMPNCNLLLILDTSSFDVHAFEPQHEISNNVVCASSKDSDQPAYMCSLIRAFASHLNIL